jgi:hypothetical protein
MFQWRGGSGAVDRYKQTTNRVRKQHLGLRKLPEAKGRAGIAPRSPGILR